MVSPAALSGKTARQISWQSMAWLLGWGLYGFVFLLPNLYRLPYGDEAMFLLQSKQMWQGLLPYRDFFQLIWPGSLWLGQAVFAICNGPCIVAIRLVMFALLCTTLWAVVDIGKRYLHPLVKLGLLVFFVICITGNYLAFSHHEVSGCLATLAVYTVCRYLRQGNGLWLWLCGLLCGAVLVTTQSLGVLLIATLFGLMLWQARKQLSSVHPAVYLLAGFSLVIAPFTIWLAASGIGAEFYRDTIAWLLAGHYSKASDWGYFSTGLVELIRMGFILNPNHSISIIWPAQPKVVELFVLGWLPILGILWAIETFWIRPQQTQAPKTHPTELSLILISAIVMLVSTFSYSTSHHITMNGWWAYLLGFMALQSLWKQFVPHTTAFRRLGIVLGVVILLLLGYTRWLYHNEPFQTKKAWLASYGTTEKTFWTAQPPQDVTTYATVIETIHQYTKKNDGLFILNASPELYLLSDRPNATRFLIIYPIYTSQAQLQEIQQDLTKNPPPFIIDDQKEWPMVSRDPRYKAFKDNPPRLKSLRHWIQKHYMPMVLNDRFVIYARKK